MVEMAEMHLYINKWKRRILFWVQEVVQA